MGISSTRSDSSMLKFYSRASSDSDRLSRLRCRLQMDCQAEVPAYRVDKITTIFVEEVKHGERGLLVTRTEILLPCLAEVHCTNAQWRNSDTSSWCEDPVVAKQALGLGRGLEHGVAVERSSSK
jgi:hypothetical protein